MDAGVGREPSEKGEREEGGRRTKTEGGTRRREKRRERGERRRRAGRFDSPIPVPQMSKDRRLIYPPI